MADQRTFAGLAWSSKGKVTRRERFLAEMNAVIPWERLIAALPEGGSRPAPAGA
jgi:transposase, IS5 family